MSLHNTEHSFAGILTEDYRLLKLAYPYMEEFQNNIGTIISDYTPNTQTEDLDVLEIGCGDGFTTNILLASRKNINLTAIDIEHQMVALCQHNLAVWFNKRKFNIVQADALEYVRGIPDDKFDVIASSWTLHNFLATYRTDFLRECFRILKSGGVFANADKYALASPEQHRVFYELIQTLFDVYFPAGKYEFLKEFVLHNIADEAPDRIMYEDHAVRELNAIGFEQIKTIYRKNLEAVLVALKP